MRATSPFVRRCVVGFILWVAGHLSSVSAQLATPSSGAVAAGNGVTVVLKADGTVWAWGGTDYGQLGNGTTGRVVTPVQNPSLSGVARIAVGADHVLAIKNDGSLWAWGYNGYGQIGNGSSGAGSAGIVSTPLQIAGMSDVIAVAGGTSHSLAVKSDGSVWAWGRNNNGQLGNGTTTNSLLPIQVSGLYGVISVAAGYSHSVALKADGTVWAWGNSLGNGTSSSSNVPVLVPSLSGVTAIAAGDYHTVVKMADGTLRVWGTSNSKGQLGNVTTAQGYSPVLVPNLADIVTISCGQNHTIAVKADGSAWGWGDNSKQQLGNNIAAIQKTPCVFSAATSVVAAAAGNHSILLREDGALIGFGENTYGELGNGRAFTAFNEAHSQKFNFTDVVQIASGAEHQLLLRGDGSAWVWGNDASSAAYPIFDKKTPLVVLASGCNNIAAGYMHSLLLKNDGTVWAFGGNSSGQLGDGTTTRRTTPVAVTALSGIIAISAGEKHSIALKADGTVWAWGSNTYGQLGNGTTTQSLTPVEVTGLIGVIAVAAGSSHNLALKSDGTVWAWGRGTYGRLGDGTTASRSLPVQILGGLSGVIAIAAGDAHSMALKANGTVWAWGSNLYQQLGDGTTVSQRTTPVQVQGSLTGVIAIAAGERHSLALKLGGTVWAWGLNNYYQLGDGTKTQRPLPVLVPELTGVTAITASFVSSMALKSDGTFRIWGYEIYLPMPYRSFCAIQLKVNPTDTEGDGLPDAWEIDHFGNLDKTAIGDADFDGLTNIQEYTVGSGPHEEDTDKDRFTDLVDQHPDDFYNGVIPLLTIISGDNQTTSTGQFNANPLDVAVWDPTGTTPYVNAPVTFEVLSGGGQLATTNVGSPSLVTTLSVNTDIDGSALAHYQQPATANVVSQIRASASTAQVVFTSTSQSSDSIEPSIPAGLFATSITDNAFTLNWTAASDNVGVIGYDIFKGGALIGNSATNQFNVTGLASLTAYSMTVKARDAAGNISGASQALTVTTQSATSAWEIAFFGAAGVSFTANPDGDTLTNLQEYEQGRHPLVSDDGIAFYVDAALGNDTTYNGFSVWPGQPTAAHGPKATLAAAITAAGTGDTILILSNPSAYQTTTLSLAGKNLVLRPVGNVIIQP